MVLYRCERYEIQGCYADGKYGTSKLLVLLREKF